MVARDKLLWDEFCNLLQTHKKAIDVELYVFIGFCDFSLADIMQTDVLMLQQHVKMEYPQYLFEWRTSYFIVSYKRLLL